MGKAIIKSNQGEGRYIVDIEMDTAMADARKQVLNVSIDKLQNEQIPAAAEQTDIEYEKLLQANIALTDYLQSLSGDPDFTTINKLTTDALNRKIDHDLALRNENTLRARLLSFQKEQQLLNREVKKLIQRPAWCIEYNENLTGAVGTVEADYLIKMRGIDGEPEKDPILLPTPHSGSDGMLQTIHSSGPACTFFNMAVYPGAQKHKPRFRVGTITALDQDNDLASVTLDVATREPDQNSLTYVQDFDPVSFSNTLNNIPIQYMTCNAKAFEVGDRVVVGFTGENWEQAKVIGFESEPRACGVFIYWGPDSNTATHRILPDGSSVLANEPAGSAPQWPNRHRNWLSNDNKIGIGWGDSTFNLYAGFYAKGILNGVKVDLAGAYPHQLRYLIDTVLEGGSVTPAGSVDAVSISSTAYRINGEELNYAEGTLPINRPPENYTRISSVILTKSGVDVVDGLLGESPSNTVGAEGGPPVLPANTIELARVRLGSHESAIIEASEILAIEQPETPVSDLSMYVVTQEELLDCGFTEWGLWLLIKREASIIVSHLAVDYSNEILSISQDYTHSFDNVELSVTTLTSGTGDPYESDSSSSGDTITTSRTYPAWTRQRTRTFSGVDYIIPAGFYKNEMSVVLCEVAGSSSEVAERSGRTLTVVYNSILNNEKTTATEWTETSTYEYEYVSTATRYVFEKTQSGVTLNSYLVGAQHTESESHTISATLPQRERIIEDGALVSDTFTGVDVTINRAISNQFDHYVYADGIHNTFVYLRSIDNETIATSVGNGAQSIGFDYGNAVDVPSQGAYLEGTETSTDYRSYQFRRDLQLLPTMFDEWIEKNTSSENERNSYVNLNIFTQFGNDANSFTQTQPAIVFEAGSLMRGRIDGSGCSNGSLYAMTAERSASGGGDTIQFSVNSVLSIDDAGTLAVIDDDYRRLTNTWRYTNIPLLLSM